MSRYVVGIDLGTTNSALAYADSREATPDKPPPIRTLRDPAGRRRRTTSASGRSCRRSCTCPARRSSRRGRSTCPGRRRRPGRRAVRARARREGAGPAGRARPRAGSRTRASTAGPRSCPGRRRTTCAKVSPVAASAAYLAHLRDAWNHADRRQEPRDRLENQDVLLTVPASFDAVARELTVEAARQAGLEQVTLLEEPQAAFYAWLAAQGDALAEEGQGRRHHPGLRRRRRHDRLHPDRRDRRRAATWPSPRWPSASTSCSAATTWTWRWPTPSPPRCPRAWRASTPRQRVALGHACRAAKETLFADPKKNAAPVAVLGRGSKVIGGSIKTELTREMLDQVLLDGFLPALRPTDLPARGGGSA